MKTSSILLAIIALVTLTSMVATDLLLKQEYEKIDWRNPYQAFAHRSLPTAKNWVVKGTPAGEIIMLRSKDSAEALIDPEQVKFYKTRQQDDTVFVTFTPEIGGYDAEPRDDAAYEKRHQIVLRMPDFQSLRIKDSRMTLADVGTDTLSIALENSRLRTKKLTVSGVFSLTMGQNSFAVLGDADQYNLLRTSVQDSSGVLFNNTQVMKFLLDVSPKAEVQLRGQMLKWLK
ncbi:hypothetical protein IC229_11565 [Spirosoma sp. BT702]|uniref:DUF2807 domain-containing protein n=1 Tax=Spirosoma profusum TaxID=2771354 RepID=A0A927AQV4_9BACT|nr:hypothetical protein [Spirosoma profusum]MBD2701278.1 hypothetical protein [Spirosoma profusum]